MTRQQPTLTKADATPSAKEHFPAFVPTYDFEAVESWDSTDGGSWKPGPLAIRSVNPSGITEWQVVDEGKALIAAVGLPELAQYVGLPASVFVTVQIQNPDKGSINPNAKWALNIDTAQIFRDAVLSPLQSYFGEYGVMFSAYVSGVLKDVGALPPVVSLAIDCFWAKDTTSRGTLLSNVSASVPRIREVGPAVVSEEICPHCLRSDGDDAWTLISANP